MLTTFIVMYLMMGLGFALVRKIDGKPLDWWMYIVAIILFPVSVGSSVASLLNSADEYRKQKLLSEWKNQAKRAYH